MVPTVGWKSNLPFEMDKKENTSNVVGACVCCVVRCVPKLG